MSDFSKYAGNYTIDSDHSELGFTARHAMITKVRGNFDEFSGTVSANEDFSNVSINVEINTGSINTNNTDRDNHLRSGDFFETEAHPQITFVSNEAKPLDEDTLRVTGDLTIKGVTKQITIDFDFNGEATDPWGQTRVGFEGETTINRRDFGLTWQTKLDNGGVLVSEKIGLKFDLSLVKQQ
ncbi:MULTISPECIES: YceI family protein [Corynebacterium]|uniref:Polyisoprenoid-binding protein n=1 Tax=Corynebacterium auriscanis TaxID=99807 RepID=A0A0A2DFY5_9CORY|nr:MULTISPECIES: YceI family protein [Corynebacterium]KGM18075.1 polyisoprenoid-binding protein [Corynebacterium auriscanis]OFT89268.1 polyisoprenoid-binding protein [Corynebacterium sp. HMSC28B08]WJY73824.1 hypothetical protein CAURIC_11180 [Corynebacterium auriscanis]